mmetsp:Transcript_16391/g.39287  ORF Transcript_16391/g.39287 Transcript_16391/m.39287 type:complete len:239 (-) Transcript_16391:1025-1741(-)
MPLLPFLLALPQRGKSASIRLRKATEHWHLDNVRAAAAFACGCVPPDRFLGRLTHGRWRGAAVALADVGPATAGDHLVGPVVGMTVRWCVLEGIGLLLRERRRRQPMTILVCDRRQIQRGIYVDVFHCWLAFDVLRLRSWHKEGALRPFPSLVHLPQLGSQRYLFFVVLLVFGFGLERLPLLFIVRREIRQRSRAIRHAVGALLCRPGARAIERDWVHGGGAACAFLRLGAMVYEAHW